MNYSDKDGIRTINFEGPIGESANFFLLPFAGLKEIHLNLEKATYMNSVGVKHWINWAAKIPGQLKVILKKAPHLVANQASMVVGFLPKNFILESFFAPYVCPECEEETVLEFKESVNYKRMTHDQAHWFKLPEPICTKCPTKPKLESDFLPEKLFGFLKRVDS